jgi:hypothetical protein
VEGILTPLFATHTGILTSKRSTTSHEAASLLLGTLPYHATAFTPASTHRFAMAFSRKDVFGKCPSPTINERQSECGGIHSFGESFSPVTFSAQSHLTSELLRTL